MKKLLCIIVFSVNKLFYSRSKNKEQLCNIHEKETLYTFCN